MHFTFLLLKLAETGTELHNTNTSTGLAPLLTSYIPFCHKVKHTQNPLLANAFLCPSHGVQFQHASCHEDA